MNLSLYMIIVDFICLPLNNITFKHLSKAFLNSILFLE